MTLWVWRTRTHQTRLRDPIATKFCIAAKRRNVPCDIGGDLHLISAPANSLELLDRISGTEFLIFKKNGQPAM
jgi:hypothetical protein